MKKRKTAFTSRISYAIGMQEGLFSRIESAVVRHLKECKQARSRRQLSSELGIEIQSLCSALKGLSDAGVLNAEKVGADKKTHRPVMLYGINE